LTCPSISSNRIRMYPSLVNCTTIDLFGDWPQDALLEVGERYLSQIELAGDDKVNHSLLFCFSMSKIRIKQQQKNYKLFIPVCNGKRSDFFFLIVVHVSLCLKLSIVFLFVFCSVHEVVCILFERKICFLHDLNSLFFV